MSQQALYRKWRSNSFDELVGQPHVVQTLQNALDSGRVAHAYIFSGPRGTGKTSSARILAKAINCIAAQDQRPCNQCHICKSITDGSALDLIEIDAASNTQVDKVRDVIVEKVHFAPTLSSIKVYIIDESHMLSNSAFNALLKTIEEPPAHAIFVLATTEIHKIPATILSRCQRLDFRRINVQEIVEHLGFVLEREGITAEEKVLELVARQATGSMRDALSLLDQLLAHGGTYLTLQQARAALGIASTEAVQGLIDYILAQDMGAALQLVNRLIDQGTDPRQFLVDILEHLRALLLILAGSGRQLLNLPETTMTQLLRQKNYIKPAPLIQIIRLFNKAGADLKLGLQPQLPIELAIVEAIVGLQERGIAAAPAPKEQLADVVEPPPPAPRPRLPQIMSKGQSRGEPPQQYGTIPTGRRGASNLLLVENQGQSTHPFAPQSPSIIAPTGVGRDKFSKKGSSHRANSRSHVAPPPSRSQDQFSSAPQQRAKKGARSVVAQEASLTQVSYQSIEWWKDRWQEFKDFLAEKGKEEATLSSSRLVFCEPHAVNGKELTLTCSNPRTLRMIQSDGRQILERALSQFSQSQITMRCVPKASKPKPQRPKNKYEEAAEDPLIKEAIEFGARIIKVDPPEKSQ